MKDIKGYEGIYAITNTGKVWSYPRRHQRKGKFLEERGNGNGYSYANLQKEGNRKYVGVHRLVAVAFIPNPLNKPCVNHIDTNRKNNNVSNLEWCTQSENCKHTKNIGHSTYGIKNPMSKLTEKQVLEIRGKYVRYSKWRSNSAVLSKEYKVCPATIVNIALRHRWNHI
jgi:hypothetical protein